jgi:regulator of replication initiation timing
VWRINSTALKINVAFEDARAAFDSARSSARDEALWLSAKCRDLLADNDRLRIENEKLRAAISKALGGSHV